MADLQVSGVAPVAGAGTTPAATAGPAAPVAAGKTDASAQPVSGASAPAAPAAPGTPDATTIAAAGTPGAIKPPSALDARAKEAAREAVKGANAAMAASNTLLVFVFDDQAHQMSVKVLDVETQKVVQRIPLQHMPATASALSADTSSGALVDTKA